MLFIIPRILFCSFSEGTPPAAIVSLICCNPRAKTRNYVNVSMIAIVACVAVGDFRIVANI